MSSQQRNQQSEFLRLLLRHERQVYGYIRSLVTNPADAEDVLQETSAVLWTKFGQFRPGSDFVAWALQVAWREVQTFRRRQQRERLQFSDAVVESLAAMAQEECGRLSDMEAALDHCMSKLRTEARDLLRRRYQREASVGELAQQMGRPVQTVYSMLKRIRRTVFECIQRTLAAGGRA
jgi:RNA polymerase sigma-70 factor, ECF subfamily